MKKVIVKKELCVGCRVCEMACAADRYKAYNHKRSRIRVPVTFPLPSPPNVCRQCTKPRCLEACPVEAIYKDEQAGVIKIDYEKCVGCLECVNACPFGAMYVDITDQVPIKCDLCNGKEPQCVSICPRKALTV